MTSWQILTVLLPSWAMPWLVVVGIGAAIMGARRLAVSCGLIVAIDVVVAPLLAPWLATLPLWVLLLILFLMGMLLIHAVIALLFGNEAAGHFSGTWLVRFGDLLLLGPFRLLGALIRALRQP